MGLTVLKTPVRAPQANAFCERLVGTIRRECLDFVIPLNERQLRRILREWVAHYHRGRPHTSLGYTGSTVGAASRGDGSPSSSGGPSGVVNRILDGLHHEYRLERAGYI
jgi:putative transposase